MLDDDDFASIIECSGEGCDELVDIEDDYYSTPCGTFCNECMADHVRECGVCANEFEEFDEGD